VVNHEKRRFVSSPGSASSAGKPAYAWTSADKFDPPWSCGGGNFTQLYNLDAVAYETVLPHPSRLPDLTFSY
jgi:hypothetical protein